jgi:two-component system, response regulator YesN
MFKGLEEIRQYIEKFMRLTVTIGVGNLCTSPEKIRLSFREALSALEYRFVIGNNKILFIQDLEPAPKKKIVFNETKQKLLIASIKFGTQDEVFKVMETLFKDVTEEATSLGDYQIYLLEMIATIIKVSKDLNLDINPIFGDKFNLFVEMFKFDTIGEVKEWFTNICGKLMKLIEYRRRNSGKILIEKAEDYIKENYHQSELSLNTMSSYLHISPNYFGSTFKNETGETFINYLLRIRMEAAKNLLCSTNNKNHHIAEKVGIPDQYYFSHCFKKYFNVSPNEFRNSLKN